MERKKIDNIEFEYAKNVLPDTERERYLSNQAAIWFEPLVERFNKEKAVVHFFLKERGENRVHFSGMSQGLEMEAYERLKLFQNPQP